MNIDIRTLVLVLIITHFIQIIVFSYQFRINKNYHGIEWWLLWSIAEVFGFLFFLLREIPRIQEISIICQNYLIILGVIFLYVGIMRFFEKKENLKLLAVIFSMFSLLFLFFLFFKNDIQIRSIAIAATLAVISFITAHALFVYRPSNIVATANFTAVIFLAHGLYFVFRTLMLSIGVNENRLIPTILNITMYLDALICSIVWTFVFVLMINQRLNSEMKEAKEEMELVFNTSPDAAIITRLSDGLIIHVNEGFCTLSGFSYEESIRKSTIEIDVWANPDDRKKFIQELMKNGYVENFESLFRQKNGNKLTGIVSAKMIRLQNVLHIISITRDITEYKTREDQLKDAVTKLQKALEEIKTLRGFVPICAYCKKIRDDKGYWEQVEQYVSKHSQAEFSHSICPECLMKLYPDMYDEIKTGKKS